MEYQYEMPTGTSKCSDVSDIDWMIGLEESKEYQEKNDDQSKIS